MKGLVVTVVRVNLVGVTIGYVTIRPGNDPEGHETSENNQAVKECGHRQLAVEDDDVFA